MKAVAYIVSAMGRSERGLASMEVLKDGIRATVCAIKQRKGMASVLARPW